MKILITAGTGLIGRALCRALLDAGHQLTVLSRKPGSVKRKCGDAVEGISSLSQWDDSRVFDAVINLAGEPIVDARWTESCKRALWDSRATLTEELVKRIQLATHKPAVLLSGSAIGYYGDRGDEILDESSNMLLGGQRVLPAKILGHGFRFAFPDIACALQAELARNGRAAEAIVAGG